MGQILKGEGSNLLPPLPTWVASPTRLYSYSPSPADKYLKDMPPKWIDSFRREDIPQATFKTQFVRSSGPGGQNVNKVSTKAEIRFTLSKATWLPAYVRAKLREQEGGRINRRDEYVLTADDTRSQVKNLESCMLKLYNQISRAAQVPKEPDQEKVERVEKMKKANKERRLREKQRHSSKKASRRGGNDE